MLKSPIYFLPWLIFLPLLWVGRLRSLVPDRHRALFKALRLALIVSFIVLSVAPGSRSRYCMPVLPLACMLIGWILSVHRSPVPSDRAWNLGLLVCLLTGCALSVAALLMVTHSGSAWAAAALAAAAAVVIVRVRRRLEGGVRLALATGLVFVVGVMESAALSAPFAQALEWRRPAGRAINERVPTGQTVYAYRTGHQPFLFYVREPLRYLVAPEQIGPEVRYLLMPVQSLRSAAVRDRLALRRPRTLGAVQSAPTLTFRLLELSPADGS